MKKLLVSAFAVLFVLQVKAQKELNVMTFNIRLDIAVDSLNGWPYRKDKVASQVLFHKTHLLGVQEALPNQMKELQERLPHYKYVGVGRSDGKEKGEFSAIFYDTLRIQLLQTQTFWLAEQTGIPGTKGWDAAIERIVTWAKFRDRKTRKVFYHFNTHYDHIGRVARRESSKLLMRKVKEIGGKQPCIITGDFNAQPAEEPITVLRNTTDPGYLIDTKDVSRQPHYGPTGTFNGFTSKEMSNEPIDYIFIKNGIEVLQHATFSQTWQGHFSSDHFPVYAVLRLK